MPRRRRIQRPDRVSPWPFVGVGGLACVFFLYAATPTIVDAPWWAVALLLLVWLAFFISACRRFTTRPVYVAVLPLVAFVLWFAAVLIGGRVLGWA
ncbi:hypothetical protein [Nocardioides sp.]|uniref:hypothetical protein n=1 Tax=Nocardioides sp. TaxID=35761 RepID=UPI0027334F7B|nr:hypothetical protein [Nocardioides sp.]MDP3891605.1 hypothetical protein [Nocardioides sp.]